MPDIISLLNYEEGFSAKPYYCSAGYPTIGIGQRIGPKGAPLKLYEFTVSEPLAAVWLTEKVKETLDDMERYPNIKAAMAVCNTARQAVLISMAYQMGAEGLHHLQALQELGPLLAGGLLQLALDLGGKLLVADLLRT